MDEKEVLVKRNGVLRFAAKICLSIALVACAATDVTQREPGSKPQDKSTDEAGIWRQMDKAERHAKSSGERISDPALIDYVTSIQCRVAKDYCGDVRVYLMRRPYFNASMAPNGYMEIWSGLMLRAENEAQLAFVIGHEVGHFEENHSLEQWRTVKNTANALMIFSIAGAAAGAGQVGDIGYLVAIASLFAYSREKEEEADQIGFDRLSAAGYDANQAAKSWQNLIAEVAESDFRSKKRRIARHSIFSTHPVTKERVKFLKDSMLGKEPGGDLGEKRHIKAIGPHLEGWIRDDLRLKDFGTSLYIMDRYLQRNIRPGLMMYMKGEAYRLRNKDGDQSTAFDAYSKALDYQDVPTKVHRALADMFVKRGDEVQALSSYKSYVAKDPSAKDIELMKYRISVLEKKLSQTQ